MGQKRLVSLATVISMRPQALLLDEPLAGLDENTQSKVIFYLKNTSQALVVVSRDKHLLREVTSKILLIKGKKLSLYKS